MPSINAFLDYLIYLIKKSTTNSINKFYINLFI